MKTWARGLIASTPMLLLVACGGGAHSRAAPVLGATRNVIDAAWTPDGKAGGCRQENLELSCYYIYHGIHVTVTFDMHGIAEQIQTDDESHSSFNLWHFLNTLVPAGSRRLSCRFVAHSIGGDTAHACVYQKKARMIVAYFLHPTDPDFGGIVTYDYVGYKDIQVGA